MVSYTATYSPEDNKLRLYASSRLDPDTYTRVKSHGFAWAPKQELFVAPQWTPEREDLLLELAGEIEDEGTDLETRQAERADRFTGYRDRRASEARAAEAAVSALAGGIPLGQPILVGHHSERHARKDAERIESGMRRAINKWETSEYWQYRAAGARSHASYKAENPVRYRRIKGLEADLRKVERYAQDAKDALELWEKCPPAALRVSRVTKAFPLSEFPRENYPYEGQTDLPFAVEKGIITIDQAREVAERVHGKTVARYERWANHYRNRIAYERAMLDEQGGVISDRFEIQVGGRVLFRSEWRSVLRVNRKDGAIVSIRVGGRWGGVVGIEDVKDYQPPTPEEAAQVAAAMALPPMANYPGESFHVMTKVEWDRTHKDYKGSQIIETETIGRHRVRSVMNRGRLCPVYLSDAKTTNPPAPRLEERPTVPASEPVVSDSPRRAYVPSRSEELRKAAKAGVTVAVSNQLFPTPPDVASLMVDYASLKESDRILEPSAGTGNIIRAIREVVPSAEVVAVEINPTLAQNLTGASQIVCADFLTIGGEVGRFDRILMNPPFENADDVKHILAARDLLNDDGRLVAICANGPRQERALRHLATEWNPLPEGSFKSSGTSVNTVLVVMER